MNKPYQKVILLLKYPSKITKSKHSREVGSRDDALFAGINRTAGISFFFSQEDCTASRCRCWKKTWRLTSSVNITSEPAAISFALLYVAEGFNFAKRNLAW
ncbi:hypothetical protein H5410_049215 [Solanum commersonii]|uniref:Uncharacterized protein n=1 Tax=Solanum commersonii TaxID=4109 RepID=A0A9J5XLQ2_SOLCO|nr:hypothetical protein H5410_049215 [Solanum commersonii]